MRNYPFYLFDLDGTLIDTIDLIYECFCHLFKETLGRIPDRREITSQIGIPLMTQFKKFFPGADDELLKKHLETYMSHQYRIYKDRVKLFPHTAEALSCLKDNGSKLAVVTSRRRRSAEIFTEETGIRKFFDIMVTPEDTEMHKPDPQPALFAIERLGMPAKDGLFVGDAEFDMACGKAAGLDTAFAMWSQNDPAGFVTSRPDIILQSPLDLCAGCSNQPVKLHNREKI